MKARKKAQFGTHVLSEPSCGFLCVCGTTGANRNDLSQRMSTAFKSLSEKVYHRVSQRVSTAFKSISCCLMLEWLKTLSYLNCQGFKHVRMINFENWWTSQCNAFVWMVWITIKCDMNDTVWSVVCLHQVAPHIMKTMFGIPWSKLSILTVWCWIFIQIMVKTKVFVLK